jgi:hypothetical protein
MFLPFLHLFSQYAHDFIPPAEVLVQHSGSFAALFEIFSALGSEKSCFEFELGW